MALSDDELMSPNHVPKASGAIGVRRMNKLPLIIAGFLVAAFLVVYAKAAYERAENQRLQAKSTEDKGGDASMYAKAIAAGRSVGFTQPVMPVLDETSVPVHKPDISLPPMPPPGPMVDEDGKYFRDEAKQFRTHRINALIDASKAKTGVPFAANAASKATGAGVSSGVGAGSGGDARTEYAARLQAAREVAQTRLAAARGSAGTAAPPMSAGNEPMRLAQAGATGQPGYPGAGAMGLSGVPSLPAPTARRNDEYGNFDRPAGQGDRWRLDSELEAPRTPFELRAGYVIPAILIGGINSDVPGQTIAQVSQNVYDTATRRYILIPQGARLVGSYSSFAPYGARRVLVAWQRIVFPDGKAFDLGSMPGADSAGYAGMQDQVNNHYLRIFGSALLMSGVTTGVALSQRQQYDPYSGPNAGNVLSQQMGVQLGNATAQLINRNLNISPTLEIRPGYRMNVTVTKDLTFAAPYGHFDYALKEANP